MQHGRCGVSLLALAMGLALALPGLRAQQAKAPLSGTVRTRDGAAVPGASVVLNPGGLRTATDARGSFTLPAVAAGEYTLGVSYIGMQASRTSLTVGAGAPAAVNVVLLPLAVSTSVTVSGSAGTGMAQTLNIERAAPNILDSLSELQIASLPNVTAADALGRLPGVDLERDEGAGKYVEIRGTAPSLSNVTVDGVDVAPPETGVNEIKLDVVPADLVSAVQVSKTLEADQNGDAIGGTANLVTRTAPQGPHASLFLNSGWAPIDQNRYIAAGDFTASDRFGARHQWGAVLTLSDDYNGRGIDDVEPVPDLYNGQLWDDEADFRQYLYTRHRYGAGGSLTDELGKNDSVYWRWLWSDFYDTGLETIYHVYTNQVVDGVNNTNVPGASNSERIPDYAIGSLILGGNHQSPSSDAWLNWQLSASRSRTLHPQFSSGADYAYNGSTSNCQFNQAGTSNPYLPQFSPACFSEAYNQSNYSMADYNDGSNGIAATLNLAGKIDTGRYYHSGGGLGTLQWGAQVQNSHQFDNSWVVSYTPNGDVPMNLFQTNYLNTNYYNNKYPAGPWNSFALSKNYVLGNPGLFTSSSDQGQDPANFDLTQLVSSAYVMNSYTAGNYTFYGGLRMEATDVGTLSMDTTVSPAQFDSRARSEYISYLPSASLTYRLNSNSDVRAAYFRGIARPEPFDLTSAVSIDITTNPFTYSVGNPALLPEYAQDADFMYERYLSSVGTFRASYFYKYLGDPIVTLQTIPTAGTYAGYRVDKPSNAGHAWVDGVELEYQQQFSHLDSALRGLMLDANFTWTGSRAYEVNPAQTVGGVLVNPGRTDNPALLRQTPITWNLAPTYTLGRLFFSYGLSYNGSSIYGYNYQTGAAGGLNGPNGDQYIYPHLEMDAQVTARLGQGVTLEFNDSNMSNEAFGFYQGSPSYDIQREYYSPTYELGLRWDLFGR